PNQLTPYHSRFFSHDPSTTDTYTLSLHDALPIWEPLGHDAQRLLMGEIGEALHQHVLTHPVDGVNRVAPGVASHGRELLRRLARDRKSTRLNSSHQIISYAVFCLKKKKQQTLKNI